MSIISLITDFGLSDNFVGVMKAVILGINPRVQIVDICHKVKPQYIAEAAFLLKGSFRYFPYGTIHLVVVDPKVGSKRKIIIAKTKDYYFIAPDNGVLWPTLKDGSPIEIVEVINNRYFLKPTSSTFHGRDIFAPIAAYVSKEKNIAKFGKRIRTIKELILPHVKIAPKILTGEIIYIDHFGNLISNIDKNMLYNFIRNKNFKISIKNKTIDKVSSNYAAACNLKPLALINSFNCLEIAINGGSAKDYFAVGKGTKIKITKLLR